MRRVLAALFALFGSTAWAVSSPADFTQAYVKALQRASPKLSVKVVGDLDLLTVDEAKHERRVFLHNAYDAYKQAPQDGHAVIERYIASFLVTAEEQPLQRDRIVPIIKDRAWLDEIRQSLNERGTDLSKLKQIWEDYNSDLVIVYAEDSPKQIRYFSSNDLAKAGLTLSDLRPLAVKNLQALIGSQIALHKGVNVSMLTAGGDYDASLLLATDVWTSGKIEVDGEIVIAIPARDVLLITGSRNAEGRAIVRAKAAELAAKAPYHLTPHLFVFRDGKFVRFKE